MAGSLFDFSAHPQLGRGPGAMVAEGLGAAARHLEEAAPAPSEAARPTLLRDDGQPIGIGEYCKLVTPSWRWDWPHLQLIQRVLDRVTAGELTRVIIQVPPRHGKSELGTVRYPAYRLELNPELRVILAAYNATLAKRFSRKVRRVAAGRLELSDERNAADEWETTHGGGIRAAGVGSGVTGMGADLIVIDDPVKSREEAESPTYRDKVWEWYTDDLFTRREPGCAIVLTMTRWHEDDLAGRILASEDGPNWTVITLPALAEEEDPLGRAVGAALCPERYDEQALAEIRRVLGTRGFVSLYQQRPAPADGLIFKADWRRYYTTKAHPIPGVPTLPDVFAAQLQSWDMSFKDGQDNDYVSGQLWSRLGADVYLLDRDHAQRDFPATLAAVGRMSVKWPNATLKLVEDKANGPAVIATARKKIPGLVAVEPEGDKVSRAHAVAPMWEAGNVWLPHPAIAPWVQEFWLELSRFPLAKHDDDVDAMTQALIRLKKQMDGESALEATQQRAQQLSEAAQVSRQKF